MKTLNKYDYLIIFYIFLQIFGIYGGFLQPIRFYTLILLPFSFFFFLNNNVEKTFKFIFIFLLLIFIQSVISFLFIDDFENGFKYFLYISFNIITIFNFIYLSLNSNKLFYSIILGWSLFLTISIPFSLYEIFTDKHFAFSRLNSNTEIGKLNIFRKFSSLTFSNYNSYSLRIIYSLPFLYSIILLSRKKLVQTIIFIFLLFSFYILLVNGTRAAILSFIIITFIYLRNLHLKYLGLYIFLFGSFLFNFRSTFVYIIFKINSDGYSDNSRFEILINSLNLMLKNYNLFGFGIGNFEYIYKKAFHKIINAPHNLFLDFLSNFGFLLLIYFIILLYKLYININKNFDKKILLMLKSSLFTLPFFSIIDSYFIQSPSTWIYFISLYLITVPQYD
jgi:hypothetical protein